MQSAKRKNSHISPHLSISHPSGGGGGGLPQPHHQLMPKRSQTTCWIFHPMPHSHTATWHHTRSIKYPSSAPPVPPRFSLDFFRAFIVCNPPHHQLLCPQHISGQVCALNTCRRGLQIATRRGTQLHWCACIQRWKNYGKTVPRWGQHAALCKLYTLQPAGHHVQHVLS